MRNYLILLAVAVLWGSQFVFVQRALTELSPAAVGMLRSALGGIILTAVCFAKGLRAEKTPWMLYALIALVDATIPFVLIAWGQLHVSSAMTSVLMGSIPLATILMAPLLLATERLTAWGLASVGVGFSGVVLLFWPKLQAGFDVGLLGAGAILIGASCFALGLLLIKKYATDHPLLVTRNILVMGALQLAVCCLVQGTPIAPFELGAAAGTAILVLGGITGLAYLLYMILIQSAGPTFASFSNYLVPLVGVLLGALWLGETIAITTIIALGLILSAIGLNQWATSRVR